MLNSKLIAVAGDWHIDTSWAVQQLRLISDAGAAEIQHVGDFGFDTTARGLQYLTTLNNLCGELNLTINVTPGNHENFPFIYNEFAAETEEGFLYNKEWGNIRVIPRGARWERNNRSFVSLGGANSINRYSLTPNVDWWAEEQITLGDLYRTVEGGYADIMLTHDCPASTPFANDGNSWPAEALVYAKESQFLVEQAVSAVKPEILFHGHHHTYHDLNVRIHDGESFYNQRVVGLDMNGRSNNVALLDTDTLTIRTF